MSEGSVELCMYYVCVGGTVRMHVDLTYEMSTECSSQIPVAISKLFLSVLLTSTLILDSPNC